MIKPVEVLFQKYRLIVNEPEKIKNSIAPLNGKICNVDIGFICANE
jgi:hypothetical protein